MLELTASILGGKPPVYGDFAALRSRSSADNLSPHQLRLIWLITAVRDTLGS